MTDASVHAAQVLGFKSDLVSLDIRDVVRKHITTGTPAAFSDSDYFSLRQIVGNQFEVHPSAVVLVGSCRMGFSLKPEKRYVPARPGSDLDLAIISPDRFNDYWARVHGYWRLSRTWSKRKRFLQAFFRGWIDPRWLPPIKRFESAKVWVHFFDDLMKSRRFGIRRITARIYHSFEFLESYQEEMVQACLDEQRRTSA